MIDPDELLARLDVLRAKRIRHMTLTVAEYDMLRAALAAQLQPLFEAVVKTTMPSSLYMDGTSPVTLAAWADTETLRQVEGQRIVVYPAPAGSATPIDTDEKRLMLQTADFFDRHEPTCRYCDGTGQYPPPGAGAGVGVFPVPCPACAAGSATPTGDDDG